MRAALEATGGPVLILLDELMDYVMQLSDQAHIKRMPGEQALLNALMDAVEERTVRAWRRKSRELSQKSD